MGALQTLFDTDRRLAIVPNVGPLVMPDHQGSSTAQSIHPKPTSLFSHNDQQNTWQALGARRRDARLGRAHGRPADAPQHQRRCSPRSRPSGNAVWLAGASVRQYQVSTSGAIRMGVDGNGRVFGSADVGAAMQRIVSQLARHARVRSRPRRRGRPFDRRRLALRSALKPASDPLFGTAAGERHLQRRTPIRSCSTTTR